MLQQKQNQESITSAIRATQSLRSRNPAIRVPPSIYDRNDDDESILAPEVVSISAATELEFEFDDMVINSAAYRRVFMQARAKEYADTSKAVGDLIDLSDSPIVPPSETRPVSNVLRDLEGLSLQALERKSTPDTAHESPPAADTVAGGNSMVPKPANPGLEEIPTPHISNSTDTAKSGAKKDEGARTRCPKCSEFISGRFIKVPPPNDYGPFPEAVGMLDVAMHPDCLLCEVGFTHFQEEEKTKKPTRVLIWFPGLRREIGIH